MYVNYLTREALTPSAFSGNQGRKLNETGSVTIGEAVTVEMTRNYTYNADGTALVHDSSIAKQPATGAMTATYALQQLLDSQGRTISIRGDITNVAGEKNKVDRRFTYYPDGSNGYSDH